MIKKYDRPILFYSLSILIPWVLWFIAAHISHMEPRTSVHVLSFSLIGIIGLLAPMIIAFILIFPDRDMRLDLRKRFFLSRKIKPIYLVLTLFLLLTSIIVAQFISLFFGYNINQFLLSWDFSFTGGIFSAWFLLLIAPIIEELAWHSYGTDCLRNRVTLFTTSVVFAIFWALWHLPLSFIKDYYQHQVMETGILYSINFAVSLFPFVIIMNWLYFRTGRNIFVTIIFHLTAGFANEIFATHPMSKVIQTIILLIISVIILWKERDLFFTLKYNDEENMTLA